MGSKPVNNLLVDDKNIQSLRYHQNTFLVFNAIRIQEFLINLKNKGLLSKFVDYIILMFRLNHQTNSISHLVHVVHVVLNFMFNHAYERNSFIDLFYEFANGLNPEGKEIFLYERKLEIEENFKNNIKGLFKRI
jgi:hypothetical protein